MTSSDSFRAISRFGTLYDLYELDEDVCIRLLEAASYSYTYGCIQAGNLSVLNKSTIRDAISAAKKNGRAIPQELLFNR